MLLPLLLGLFGWWYANAKFNEIDRVPVSSVLTPTGGGGTNYLILGSDSREAVVDAGGTDPNVQPNDESPSGQRSDTMLVLRTSGDGAKILSIPRDLFVTLPNGSQGRINGAYNDGPAAIIQTIQSNLQIPIHRYIEVDFVTFSSLVDALGGITLGADIIPCPAFDERAGLNIPTAGPVELDGATALGFVRSRHYTEVCDGVERTDPTGDLGRIDAPAGLPAHRARRGRRQPQPVHAHAHRRLGHRRPAHRRRHGPHRRRPVRLEHGQARPGVGGAADLRLHARAAAPRCSASSTTRPPAVLDQFR